MTTLTIRPALPQHRQGLARCIAEGFERDFSALCKDTEKTARAIEGGIRTSRFWVAEEKDIPAGTAALSDCRERAVRTDRAGYLKHFGPLRGRLALLVLKGEFEAPAGFPAGNRVPGICDSGPPLPAAGHRHRPFAKNPVQRPVSGLYFGCGQY